MCSQSVKIIFNHKNDIELMGIGYMPYGCDDIFMKALFRLKFFSSTSDEIVFSLEDTKEEFILKLFNLIQIPNHELPDGIDIRYHPIYKENTVLKKENELVKNENELLKNQIIKIKSIKKKRFFGLF